MLYILHAGIVRDKQLSSAEELFIKESHICINAKDFYTEEIGVLTNWTGYFELLLRTKNTKVNTLIPAAPNSCQINRREYSLQIVPWTKVNSNGIYDFNNIIKSFSSE